MAELPPTLLPIRPAGDLSPLFCVHAVSGSAYGYAGLGRVLPAGRPVYGLEAPGFDDGRPPARSIEHLSAGHVDALRAVRPDGPYCLLGWSMGGVVAFDMAVRLAAAGAEVATLILVDSYLPTPGDRPDQASVVRQFAADLAGAANLADRSDLANLANLADLAELADLADLDGSFLEHRFAVFSAHVEALFGYRPTGTHHGPAALLEASESPPKGARWRTVIDRLEERQVPGDHHSIWQGDRLRALGAAVHDSLAHAVR